MGYVGFSHIGNKIKICSLNNELVIKKDKLIINNKTVLEDKDILGALIDIYLKSEIIIIE